MKAKPKSKRPRGGNAHEKAPFSVRLSTETEAIVRKISKAEQRSYKSVIERAVAFYADGNGERSVVR